MSASASSSSCSQVKLPLAPEDITPGWLSSMLGHRVKSFERTRDIFATTTKLYLKLTYENEDSARLDRPACVVVKAGLDPVIMQAYPLLVTLYRREAEWFSKVAPLLTHMEVPRAWRSEWNDEQGGVLILEDLTARGCTFGAPTDLWTVDMVLEGAEQLAALHASTWGWSRETKPWLNTRHYDDIIMNMMNQCQYADFIKLDYRPKVPAYLHDEARTRAMLRKHFASRNPRFQCLLHGDPHPSNTYFVQEGKPRFLDWQVVDVGSCFHDLAYFALGALTIEDRRANETRILDHYLDALVRFGGPTFSREDPEVWLEYQKSCLSGFAWCITPREAQPESYINAMLPRYIAAFEDHNLFELIESLPEPTAV